MYEKVNCTPKVRHKTFWVQFYARKRDFLRGGCVAAVGERVAVCGEVLSVKDAKMSTSLRLSWLASVL